MPAEIEDYNGHPVIALKRNENDIYPFRFGLRKAQLILDNLDEIKCFVEKRNISGHKGRVISGKGIKFLNKISK